MSPTHEVLASGGLLTKRYLSWDRDEHRREWAVLSQVHAHTRDLAPVPVSADLDADPPTVTMSLLPGRPLTGALSPAELDGLAAALRTLWSVPCADLPPRRDAPDEFAAAVADRLAAADRPAGPAGEAYDVARAWLRDAKFGPGHTEVLGGADPNLANYLWDGERVRIVDFEDAGRSDPEIELADLVEHLEARATDWSGFLAGFDPDPDRLLAGRRLFAAFWLHLLLPGGRAAARNPPGTLERQAARVLTLFVST
ncbi:phosphotransferase [Longispora sp. NPDC051575]|uniref:phosphotransferase n=1 Tax=Longispora sp. NPDC051575 TaxID=3154943 RepID=UPI003419D607